MAEHPPSGPGRSFPVEHLQVGMVLPGDVFVTRPDGRRIQVFKAGQTLQSEGMLWQLKAHGVGTVELDLPIRRLDLAEGGQCPPQAQRQFGELRQGVEQVGELGKRCRDQRRVILSSAARGGQPSLGQLLQTLLDQAGLLENRPTLGLVSSTLNRLEEEHSRRAQNSAWLLQGLALARSARVTREDLITRALAGLLHDIGQVDCLPGPEGDIRGSEDYPEHPLYGETILRSIPGLPGVVSTVAAQHHERWNGQGFPAGLKGDEIHPLSLEVGLVDAWLDLLQPRGSRQALPAAAAVNVVRAWAGREFPEVLVTEFLDFLGPWPLGSAVELSDGRTGIVALGAGSSPEQPVVALRSNLLSLRLEDMARSPLSIRRGTSLDGCDLQPEEVF
jgi:HD-GYP domain-containing protein (c-di-GMP phosphodiesterase class II)